MELSCPLGTTRRIPQEKFPRKPYHKSFIDQACSVKMAGYWPCSFFASLWTSTPSRSINTQKKELGQYPAILISHLVNNTYIMCPIPIFQVFFWGQLDLPKGEKARRKQSSITTSTEPFDTVTLQRKEDRGPSPAEYKVEFTGDTGIVQHHLAVVGRPFEVKILQRDGNTGSSSCTVRAMNRYAPKALQTVLCLQLIPVFSFFVYRSFELKQLTSKTRKKSTLKVISNSHRKAMGRTLHPWFSVPKVPSEFP